MQSLNTCFIDCNLFASNEDKSNPNLNIHQKHYIFVIFDELKLSKIIFYRKVQLKKDEFILEMLWDWMADKSIFGK